MPIKLFILLGLALMPALAAAQAPRTVTVGRGDSIIVHVAPDGTLWAAAPTPPPRFGNFAAAAPALRSFEAAGLARMGATALPGSQVQPPIPLDHGSSTTPVIKPGQVRIT